MTVNGICHATWQTDELTHVCAKRAEHGGIGHLCACGELLLSGRYSLTDEQIAQRQHDCPECLARSGRPCHMTTGAVMTGVHASRAALVD